MKVVVLGAGMMGSAVAADLAASEEISAVIVADINEENLRACADADATGKLEVQSLDASDTKALLTIMEDAFAGISALAHVFSMGVVGAAIETGTHLVDLVGSQPEAKLALDEKARRSGSAIIPGFGLAPGLTNVLVGRGFMLLDSVDTAVAKVGGIPQDPEPPLQYRVLYSMESTFNQYVRPSLIVRDGEPVWVDALSDLEVDRYADPMGECESFVTDGLSTLPFTMDLEGVKYMAEKTLRYPGHAAKIQTLIDCGLFETDPVIVQGQSVVPRTVLDALLAPRIMGGDSKDVSILRAEISGTSGGTRATHRFDLVDFYDESRNMTSMARTTAFPCAAAVRMLIRGDIPERGMLAPELVFADHRYDILMQEIGSRGVVIEHQVLND